MGYVEQTLATSEQILHRANFNWTYSLMAVIWFALGAASIVFFFYIQYVAGVAFEELVVGWWAAIIAGACGTWLLITHLVVLITTEIVVTSTRFVYKRGLISRNTKEVSLSKIEEIVLQQSVWGRVFGYGKLVLRGTGVGVIELPDLDNPIELRRIIENARSSIREDRRDLNGD